MTELLYLTSTEAGYERTFRARVVSLPPGGVVLDRTYFYAVGGGQPADRGTLRRDDGIEWQVADVGRSGSAVVHRLGRASRHQGLPRVGDELEGSIDWDRRHRHMRCHTAQHLLSARIFARAGLRTRHAVIEQTGARIELESAWPSGHSYEETAADLRDFVARALPVEIRFVPRAEYDREPGGRSGLVPLAPTVDPVRLIEIDGIDRCPCGGTHVRNTSEIGALELAPLGRRPDGVAEVSFRLTEPSAAATPRA